LRCRTATNRHGAADRGENGVVHAIVTEACSTTASLYVAALLGAETERPLRPLCAPRGGRGRHSYATIRHSPLGAAGRQRFVRRAEATFARFLGDAPFAAGMITLCTGITLGSPGSIPSC
jgi:hypothetical protein